MEHQERSTSKAQLQEWAILDTFDMFRPECDQPQKTETVASWFRSFGLTVTQAGMIEYKKGFAAATVSGAKPIEKP